MLSYKQNGTWDGTVRDFDSLSRPIPRDKTGREKKDALKQLKRTFLNRKEHSKRGKDVLKQENDNQKQEI